MPGDVSTKCIIFFYSGAHRGGGDTHRDEVILINLKSFSRVKYLLTSKVLDQNCNINHMFMCIGIHHQLILHSRGVQTQVFSGYDICLQSLKIYIENFVVSLAVSMRLYFEN